MSPVSIDVLLVEDNPGDARLVREMLRDSGSDNFRLHHAHTLGAGLEHLTSGVHTDVVLLDLSLPDESGLATVRRVVASAGHTSVVVMTGADDEELGIAAMQEGAQDYLVKGKVDGQRLRRVLRFAIERQGKLRNESQTDDLTGLHNRRGFLMLAEKQIAIARRNRNGFLLLFLDLDGLKDVNDTFGHAEGNRALLEAADVLGRACAVHLVLDVALVSLQRPEHVGHGRIVEPEIVCTRELRVICIKSAQEIVDVIRASAARDQRQIGRRDTEPTHGIVFAQRARHRVERTLTREHQVLHELILGQAEIGADSVIADILCRVTAQAVVDHKFGAALQRSRIGHVVVCSLEHELTARCMLRRGKRRERHRAKEHP